MSRFDSDYDYFDQPWNRPGDATCSDCGADFSKAREDVGSLCDTCCSLRDTHTSAVEIRMAQARLKAQAVIEVAIVPLGNKQVSGIVDVALVPISEARELKRMAKAVLAADLTNVKDVA